MKPPIDYASLILAGLSLGLAAYVVMQVVL